MAAQGFRVLVLTDNHGGPRHQIAIEKAVRLLQRRHGFALVAPSLRFCRLMVEQDPRLLAERGIRPGNGGDVTDSHAGVGETAMVLAFAPEMVLPWRRELPRTMVPETALPKRLLAAVSGAVEWLVGAQLAGDLARLGHTLSWIQVKPMPIYLGAPAQASAELGEQLLEGHVAEAMAMLEEVRAGKPPFSEPVLWGLRFIERS